MTSPSTTLALARQMGASLGLTEGLDGSSTRRMLPRDLDAFLDASKEIYELNDERYSRCQAEFGALYLPSLVRTFFNNPIDACTTISPYFLLSVTSLIMVHVPSAAFSRFIRERPAEATELRIKALNLILEWSDRINTPPDSDWTDVMERFVLLYYNLSVAEAVGQDVARAETDPLRISIATRTKLRTCLKQLEAIQAEARSLAYAPALDDVRAVVFPDKNGSSRGSEFIDKLVNEGGYCVWWACEAKRRNLRDTELVTPCDERARDELRVCARCLSVRYCSERHQKEHWKVHKPFCVAPTW